MNALCSDIVRFRGIATSRCSLHRIDGALWLADGRIADSAGQPASRCSERAVLDPFSMTGRASALLGLASFRHRKPVTRDGFAVSLQLAHPDTAISAGFLSAGLS
jgi:hypothetical protein